MTTLDTISTAQRDAQRLANRLHAPTYVIAANDRYYIQDEGDLAVYFADVAPAAIVAAYEPEPPPEPSDDNPDEDCTPDTIGPHQLRAVSLQSIAIESRINVCPFCRGIHHIQKCPRLLALLHAPVSPKAWKDVALGRELCRMRWRYFTAFVALLRSLPIEHLHIYAESYIAFVRDHAPESDLLIRDVLTVWMRLIATNGAARQAA